MKVTRQGLFTVNQVLSYASGLGGFSACSAVQETLMVNWAGADEGNRTPTPSLAADFESATSTSSITSANILWQGHKDLNPEPSVLETAVLPIELYPCIISSKKG